MRNRGFTVLEALVTTMLVLIVLGVAASLISSYQKVSRQSRSQDQAMEAACNALHSVRADLQAALSVSATGSNLALVRVNPGKPGRFAVTPGMDWLSRRANYNLSVDYGLDAQGNLVRGLTPAGEARTTAVLARGIQGFAVTRVNDPNFVELYHLDLSFRMPSGVVKTIHCRIARMLPP